MTQLSMFSYFSNDFELKEFGWFDTDCGYTGSYVSGWQLQTRALCEREVTRAWNEGYANVPEDFTITEKAPTRQGLLLVGSAC